MPETGIALVQGGKKSRKAGRFEDVVRPRRTKNEIADKRALTAKACEKERGEPPTNGTKAPLYNRGE